jgi:predicted transcriptional regulator
MIVAKVNVLKAETKHTDELIATLKARRLELGLSQQDLGWLVTGRDNGQDYISKIENGVYENMNSKTMYKFCKALRLQVILKPEKNIKP